MSRWNAGVLAALLLVWVSSASAQTPPARVEGVVRDVSGGALPGATVRVVHAAAGVVATAFTDDHGYFVSPPLAPGPCAAR